MLNTVVLCINILVTLFSMGWAVWGVRNLRRLARERQQAFDDMISRQDDNERG